MAFPLSPWTDELVQQTKDLWPFKSASEISKIIANEHKLFFSKSSIISKMKREGLEKASIARPVRERPRRESTKTFQPKSRVELAPFIPRIVEAAPRHLTIYELTDDVCKYECSNSENPAEYTFCGHPKFKGIYCQKHAALIYVPARQPTQTFREKVA